MLTLISDKLDNFIRVRIGDLAYVLLSLNLSIQSPPFMYRLILSEIYIYIYKWRSILVSELYWWILLIFHLCLSLS